MDREKERGKEEIRKEENIEVQREEERCSCIWMEGRKEENWGRKDDDFYVPLG